MHRTKLDEALSQWHSYSELINHLSEWLKDFERKLKQEAGPRADLPSKQNQLDVIRVMISVITQHIAVCYVHFFPIQ